MVLIAVGVLGTAVAASAQAELESSSPAAGAVLATAPEVVTITYSEGVTAQPGSVRVVDARGDRVDTGATTATGSVVRAPLRGGLADGSYLVAWRVVSADSHPVRGAFTFSVGRNSLLDDGLAQKAFVAAAITQAGVLGIVLGEGVWWSLAVTGLGLGLVAMALCVGLASKPTSKILDSCAASITRPSTRVVTS